MPLCDKCGKTFDVGRCPHCSAAGAELSETSLTWPSLENGESVPPIMLTTVDPGLSGEILIKKLEICGIPVVKRYPMGGMMMTVLFGQTLVGIDLLVPETVADEARAILGDVSDGDPFGDFDGGDEGTAEQSAETEPGE